MVGVQSVHMVVTHLVDGGIAATFILTLTTTMEVTMALFHLIHLAIWFSPPFIETKICPVNCQ